MSPPELPRNAPVSYSLQPVNICLIKVFRNKFQFSGFNRIYSGLCKLLHRDKPLFLRHRLYCRFTPVVCSDSMLVILDRHEKTELFKIIHDFFPCLVSIQAGILSAVFVYRGIVIHYIYDFQVVSLPNLEIIRIVCRCDLHTPGSKFHIHIGIRNHRNLSSGKRKLKTLSDYILVPVIIWVHRNCRVSEHSFRTRRGNLDKPAFLSDDGIVYMPEMPLLIHMLNLGVGYGCLTYRAPVYNSVALVYVSLLKQLYKNRLDRLRATLIHGKALSLPVCGGAKLLKLVYDPSAVFLFPLPGIL